MQVHQANADIFITDIGDVYYAGGALLCRTDRTDCCNIMRAGEWIYPNGTHVRTYGDGQNDPFYRNRGNSTVRLNRRYGATGPTGFYCCEVPSVVDLNARICINIIGTADWISHP